jgi:hypothetical protein
MMAVPTRDVERGLDANHRASKRFGWTDPATRVFDDGVTPVDSLNMGWCSNCSCFFVSRRKLQECRRRMQDPRVGQKMKEHRVVLDVMRTKGDHKRPYDWTPEICIMALTV